MKLFVFFKMYFFVAFADYALAEDVTFFDTGAHTRVIELNAGALESIGGEFDIDVQGGMCYAYIRFPIREKNELVGYDVKLYSDSLEGLLLSTNYKYFSGGNVVSLDFRCSLSSRLFVEVMWINSEGDKLVWLVTNLAGE